VLGVETATGLIYGTLLVFLVGLVMIGFYAHFWWCVIYVGFCDFRVRFCANCVRKVELAG
jgi:hypothetical protein